MFTGIIEEVGTVAEIDESGDLRKVRIQANRVLEGAQTGASISVNGVCLTVVSFDPASFAADMVLETLNRTSLKNLGSGSLVNLERPMRADGRFDGHIVQGHVDGVGRIASFGRNGDNWNLEVELPESGARYVVEKGSIAIDGISLTVAAVNGSLCRVAIIPHTLANTNLKKARSGDLVNLEFDIVAKYVEKMMNR